MLLCSTCSSANRSQLVFPKELFLCNLSRRIGELVPIFQMSQPDHGGGGRYRATTKKGLALTGLISIIQVLGHLMEYRPIVSGLYSLFKFVVFYIHQLLWCFVIKFRLIKCKYVNPSTVDKCQKFIFMQRQAIAILRSNNHPLSNTQ